MFEWMFSYPRSVFEAARLDYQPWLPVWLIALLLIAAAILATTLLIRHPRFTRTQGATIAAVQIAFLGLLGWLLLQPVLLNETLRPGDNLVALVLDDSASMRFDNPERINSALTALADGSLETLENLVQIERYDLSQSVPVEQFAETSNAISQSDFSGMFEALLAEASQRPLAAIVLVSDGLDTSGVQGSATEDRLVASGVPVFTIGVGAETIADDLALTDVNVAAEAMPGSVTNVTMDILHDGPATARIRVFDGPELLHAETVQLESDKRTRHQVALELERTGFHDLRFNVEREGGEVILGNNSLSRTVRVSDRRYRVLHIEGEPRWEYKFLRRALADDASVELVSWLKVSPNKYYRQGIASAQELQDGFPVTEADLYRYDAVIVGSVEAATLSPQQQQLLHDFVSLRGGALMLLGGSSGLGSGGWGESLLGPALPARLPAYDAKSFQRTRASVFLTPAGAASAFLTLDDENLDAWESLPELADYQTTGELKPAAVSLLDVRTEAGRQPLLITQPYGNGRTFIMATGGTWRWQMSLPVADTRHETFWRQLLHELVSGTASRSSVSLSAGNNEQLVVRARFLGPDWRPQNATLTATLGKSDGETQALAMTPVAGTDWYEAIAAVQAGGLYYAEVSAEHEGKVIDVARASARLDNRTAEDARIRRDTGLLQHLAELTGGKYLDASDISQLADSIQTTAAGVTTVQRLPLWNMPAVLLALLVFKLTDWLLRRRWSAI